MSPHSTRLLAAFSGQQTGVLLFPLILPFLLLLTFIVYWPGLSGPFLFDDFANLNALGAYGGVRDLETLRLYVLGGQSGPTGRPISLLSFLLDGQNWPTDPRPFKVTNLLLHLLNGIALFAITRQLLLLMGSLSPNRVTFVASLASGAWLLHPYLVSTVMYPVQRMAILSTLFTLLGLWGYVHGRLLLKNHPWRAYLWMSLSLAGGTLLAMLSKENGILLPLLALVLEAIILRSMTYISPSRLWSLLFLWIPAVLPLAYVFFRALNGSLAASFLRRSFDVWERLLTETRILFDYLSWWYLPRVHSPGVLIHKYPLSHGLLDPPITLLAVLGLAGLILAAIALRKRYPLASLAILFFFAAHWLESGPLSLELYFEHRNYLPAVFLFLPVMAALSRHDLKYHSLILISPAILAALAMLTFQRTSIWGNEERLAYSWATTHPYSQRAQRYAALTAEKHGKPGLAIAIIHKARKRDPNNVMFALHDLNLQCNYHSVNQPQIDAFIDLLKKPYRFRSFKSWRNFVIFAPGPDCKGIDYNDVLNILETLKDNSLTQKSRSQKQRVLHLIGQLEANSNNRANAYRAFLEAQRVKPDIERALLQSSILATKGYYPEALSLLEYAKKVYYKHDETIWPERRGKLNYRLEIETLEKQLRQDFQKQIIEK